MKNLFLTIVVIFLQFKSLYAETEKLVILGAGPSGMTAAIFAGQGHLHPIVIEGKRCGGQLFSINKIENYPGFPEGISGLELRERLHRQAEIFGARFQSNDAASVNLSVWPFHITLADDHEISCESLIIATGCSPKLMGVEGEESFIGKGISTNAVLDAPKYEGKEVLVVGGGDSAMEQALLLAEHAAQVTIVYSKNAFLAADYLQERVFKHSKIQVIFENRIICIQDSSQGSVTGVVLQNTHTYQEISFACEGIFIANGRQPNTEIFKGQLEMDAEGYIMTKPNTTETSISGVFVAGDSAQSAYRKVVTATASGCMSAIDAKRFLLQKN